MHLPHAIASHQHEALRRADSKGCHIGYGAHLAGAGARAGARTWCGWRGGEGEARGEGRAETRWPQHRARGLGVADGSVREVQTPSWVPAERGGDGLSHRCRQLIRRNKHFNSAVLTATSSGMWRLQCYGGGKPRPECLGTEASETEAS